MSERMMRGSKSSDKEIKRELESIKVIEMTDRKEFRVGKGRQRVPKSIYGAEFGGHLKFSLQLKI